MYTDNLIFYSSNTNVEDKSMILAFRFIREKFTRPYNVININRLYIFTEIIIELYYLSLLDMDTITYN